MQNKDFNKMYAKIRDLNDSDILDEGAWSDLWHGSRQEKKSDQATKDAYDAYRLEKVTKKFEKDGLSSEDARKYAYRKVYGAPVEESRMGFKDLDKLGRENASKVDQEARRRGSADMEPGDADRLRYKVAKEMGLVEEEIKEDEGFRDGHDIELLKKVSAQIAQDVSNNDYTAIDDLLKNVSTAEMQGFLSELESMEALQSRAGMTETNISKIISHIKGMEPVTESKSPPEVINPTADSSPADLKAAIKYAKYMKAKMDTDKATATYDKEIAQLEGWLKSKSTMKTEGKMSDIHQDAQENDKEDFIAMHKGHMSAEEAGKMWDEVQKQMNEDFDSSHPDFPKAQAFTSEKDAVKDIIAKHPEAAKTLQQSGDVFSIYDTDLYMDLFDHFSEEMPYGTQKGRDGDPVEWINDELDTMGILESTVAYKVEEGTQKPFVSLTKGIWTVTDGNGNDVNGFDNKEEAFTYLEKHYNELLDPQPIRLKRTQSDIDYMKQMDNSHALIYGESRNTYFHRGDKEFKVIPEGYKKTKNGTITKVLK